MAGATATPGRIQSTSSAASERSAAFVESHRSDAERLGRDLANHVSDPEAFLHALRAGLAGLSDPTYLDEQARVAPGLGRRIGVRNPLLSAVHKAFDRATRREHPDTFLWIADRLLRDDGHELEVRVVAFHLLARLLPHDPERAWQLLRLAARTAADWITVDTLAHAFGAGILAEPYRWAELEQLVYSPSRWERRLVGSTIATIPFVNRGRGREQLIADRSLPILAGLIGDAEEDVQKAISWALRSLLFVDPRAVVAFCQGEARKAAATDDGHRAWVVRDTLPKLEQFGAIQADEVVRLRQLIATVRRRPNRPPTSDAAAAAARFVDLSWPTRDADEQASTDTTGRPQP